MCFLWSSAHCGSGLGADMAPTSVKHFREGKNSKSISPNKWLFIYVYEKKSCNNRAKTGKSCKIWVKKIEKVVISIW